MDQTLKRNPGQETVTQTQTQIAIIRVGKVLLLAGGEEGEGEEEGKVEVPEGGEEEGKAVLGEEEEEEESLLTKVTHRVCVCVCVCVFDEFS